MLQKFRSKNTNVEDQETLGCPFAIDNQYLKSFVAQNPSETVKEIPQPISVNISTILHHLKKIGTI